MKRSSMKSAPQSLPQESGSILTQMIQRLPLSDIHFRRICQLIYQRAGIVLAEHKREMVYNRLVRRLRLLNISDFGQYLALLESDPNSAEWQAFVNALTTNLTAFFREAHHFRSWQNMLVSGRAVIQSGVRRHQPVKNLTPSL